MTKSLRPFRYSTSTLVPHGQAVDPAGVEPALPARQAGVAPLDHRPRQPVRSGGRIHALRLPRPADYRFPTPCTSGPPGNRTPISALRRRRLPVGRAAPREVRPGVEPGLPRLPGRRAATTLPDHSVAEAGFEPAWERLMRPCWCLTPVHSVVPPAGLEPALASTSGRCRGRWATGVNVSSPGWI